MKNLFKRHYNAIVNRGLITPETTLEDFRNKIKEEYTELFVELISSKQLTKRVIHESLDLINVVTNMLKHFGVDLIKEQENNINYQEKRNELNRINYKKSYITQIMLDGYKLESLLGLACKEMDVSIYLAKTKTRQRNVVDARFIYFYIAKKLTKLSLETIGSIIPRDHSSVIHGIKEVNRLDFLKKRADKILKLCK